MIALALNVAVSLGALAFWLLVLLTLMACVAIVSNSRSHEVMGAPGLISEDSCPNTLIGTLSSPKGEHEVRLVSRSCILSQDEKSIWFRARNSNAWQVLGTVIWGRDTPVLLEWQDEHTLIVSGFPVGQLASFNRDKTKEISLILRPSS